MSRCFEGRLQGWMCKRADAHMIWFSLLQWESVITNYIHRRHELLSSISTWSQIHEGVCKYIYATWKYYNATPFHPDAKYIPIWHQKCSLFFLHTATQLVRVSNDLLPLQYFYISQSAYLQIQASQTNIFILFVLFLSALSNIIMHLDDTEVLHCNYDCSVSGGRGKRCAVCGLG